MKDEFVFARQLTGRVVILSLLYFGLIWCARNARAHFHNFTVYRHKASVLETYETFAEAAKRDPQTAAAMLAYATRAIFEQQPTGFTREHSEGGNSPMIEVFRSFRSGEGE